MKETTRLKTFAFLVEPGSYTVDLVKNVYEPLRIGYAFFHDAPLIARSNKPANLTVLGGMPFLKKIRFLNGVYDEHDFFIFNGYNTFEFFYFFLRTLLNDGKKLIAIESDTKFNPRSGIKGLAKKLYLEMLFKQAFMFGFAGGNYTHKKLFRHYGMDEKRIYLLPMMVDNAKFYPTGRPQTDPFVFLYVGRMIPLKNIELLIKSFLEAFGENRYVRLRIVGGGELYEPLKAKYGGHANIEFTGPKFGDELVEAYHKANVFVLPSDREQWGLVVNEALAAGLPVIASNRVGAIYDLIENKETGLVFDPAKPHDLTEKLTTLYKDRNLYETMRKNALELMRNEWNYDLYRANLLRALEYGANILGKGKPS